ncbi:20401_t:CDS:1, partial [Gigaspora rosea]
EDFFQVAGSSKEVVNFSQELVNSSQKLIDLPQELVNSSQKLIDLPQELVESPQELVNYEIYKEQELVGVNGLLLQINKTIVFAINNTFYNWPIAEHYVV